MANCYLRYEGDNGGNNNVTQNTCDVDGNGKINSGDLYSIIRYLKEHDDYTQAFDCNKDGKVNSADLYYIITYLKQN